MPDPIRSMEAAAAVIAMNRQEAAARSANENENRIAAESPLQ